MNMVDRNRKDPEGESGAANPSPSREFSIFVARESGVPFSSRLANFFSTFLSCPAIDV